MTPQQIDAMKLALEALKGLYISNFTMPNSPINIAITALEKALAKHAMQEVQRLGQEIEQEPKHYPHTWGKDGERCVVCGDKDWMGTSCKKISAPQPEQEPVAHWSDCAVHSEPAYPKGECDCGGIISVADYTALSDKYVALSDKYVALKAQPEQEPVAWINPDEQNARKAFHWVKSEEFSSAVYTHSPQRTEQLPQRKPLTDEQYFEIGQRHWLSSSKVEQIHKELEEAAHGIKENT